VGPLLRLRRREILGMRRKNHGIAARIIIIQLDDALN
jgi:hypothetical protein